MSIFEILLFAVALSIDAFAIAVCIGLSNNKFCLVKAVTVGVYFGLFQAGMPLVGYWAGEIFAERIAAYDHWVAFGLLVLLGGKMIFGSLKGASNTSMEDGGISGKGVNSFSVKFSVMIPLAFATSIDALAVGVSFAFMQVNIVLAVIFIGVTTFITSVLGVKLGGIVGERFKSKAELAGGIVLVSLGVFTLISRI